MRTYLEHIFCTFLWLPFMIYYSSTTSITNHSNQNIAATDYMLVQFFSIILLEEGERDLQHLLEIFPNDMNSINHVCNARHKNSNAHGKSWVANVCWIHIYCVVQMVVNAGYSCSKQGTAEQRIQYWFLWGKKKKKLLMLSNEEQNKVAYYKLVCRYLCPVIGMVKLFIFYISAQIQNNYKTSFSLHWCYTQSKFFC